MTGSVNKDKKRTRKKKLLLLAAIKIDFPEYFIAADTRQAPCVSVNDTIRRTFLLVVEKKKHQDTANERKQSVFH